MGNSLQDQLKRSGLVDDKKLRKARQEKRSKRKRGEGEGDGDALREQTRRAAAEKAARDRALNLERQEHADAQARAAQVRQLVERSKVPRGAGDVVYNFTDGKAVRRLHLDAATHAAVVAGMLAVVRLDDGHELVPAAVARQIAERDPGTVLVLNEAAEPRVDDADGYEGYEVPDDLMW